MGWCRWNDFPTGDLQKSFNGVHLRLQVWSNAAEKKIAVAFGGTCRQKSQGLDLRLAMVYPAPPCEFDRVVLRYRHQRYGADWKDEEYPIFLDSTRSRAACT